jgi:hypothetical protein
VDKGLDKGRDFRLLGVVNCRKENFWGKLVANKFLQM